MSQNLPKHASEGGAPGSGLGVADIYFVLFRRKWFVVAGLLLGILGAAVLWKIRSPLFQSTAKIMVRYVHDSQSVVNLGPATQVRSPIAGGGNVLASEGEILTSLDVAREAAEAVGPERVCPGSDPTDSTAAAFYIKGHVRVDISPQLAVVTLTSRHRSPDVARDILEKVIEAYLKKHHKVHSDIGGSESALSERRTQLQAAITSADAELKGLKATVSVGSIEEFKKANAAEESKLRQEWFEAEADLAQQRGTLEELQRRPGPNRASGQAWQEAPPAKVKEYAALVAILERMQQWDADLARSLTPSNPQVQTNRLRIAQHQVLKEEMEKAYPGLANNILNSAAALPSPLTDLHGHAARIQGLEARIEALSNRLTNVQAKAKEVEEVEPKILKLQKDIERFEAQLTGIERVLQQRQFDQILGSTPNIQKVQLPSVPSRDFMALYKKMAMTVLAGLGFGIALAFFIELILDTSLRRPKEIESALGVPLLLSVPYLPLRSTGLLGRSNEQPAALPPEPAGLLKPYHEALRDRLVNHFEARQMTHKPKMIAVTSCDEGAGVSSVAVGLAASLSEIGEGNVLLVDMRGSGAAHAFFLGKPACGLEEALEHDSRTHALVQENLYVVSASSADQKLERVAPRHFGDFVPRLKASDYEYIIFDMPPVSPTSLSAKLARFMDMILLVIESGKTGRDVAGRAAALVAESKATVTAVLNKRQRYVPRWLLQEFD